MLWNAAYEVGGPACTIQQFEQLTGIRVDNTVIVDFSGFKAMVDAVGGVQICSPEAIDDPKSGLDLRPGTQTISGDEALAYVRARETVGDGSDLGRIKRQQAFVAAMAASVVSGKVLANPVTAFNLAEAVTQAIDTDFDSLRGLVELGYQFRGVGLGRIQFVTVPVADHPADPNHVEWTDAADALWAKVAGDAPLGELRDQAITAADQPTAPPGSADPSGPASASPSGSPPASPSGSPPSGLDADAREDVGLCS